MLATMWSRNRHGFRVLRGRRLSSEAGTNNKRKRALSGESRRIKLWPEANVSNAGKDTTRIIPTILRVMDAARPVKSLRKRSHLKLILRWRNIGGKIRFLRRAISDSSTGWTLRLREELLFPRGN